MPAVAFSALGFLCVVLPKDASVQVQARQERVPCPRLSATEDGREGSTVPGLGQPVL